MARLRGPGGDDRVPGEPPHRRATALAATAAAGAGALLAGVLGPGEVLVGIAFALGAHGVLVS